MTLKVKKGIANWVFDKRRLSLAHDGTRDITCEKRIVNMNGLWDLVNVYKL